MARRWQDATPEEILHFWFPEGLADADGETIGAFWHSRMQGGMDAAIIRDHAEVTRAGAEGRLDHWAETPEGRLALILVLDQFPRSLWRETPGAFGQDIKACRLALDGLANGHFDALPDMHRKQFYIICISHCEGPDHLERMDLCLRLNQAFLDAAEDDEGRGFARQGLHQAHLVRSIIARFGRHPHRNPILGRISTPDEQAYIDTGDFPHVRSEPTTT